MQLPDNTICYGFSFVAYKQFAIRNKAYGRFYLVFIIFHIAFVCDLDRNLLIILI